MIDTEASKVLTEYSKHIARWAKLGDKEPEKVTAASHRAHENAWRLLSHLLTWATHVKESDHYWLLCRLANERGESEREKRRLYSIAKSEDRGYVDAKANLDQLLAEMLAEERADPKAERVAAKLAVARAAKQAALEEKAERKKAMARERRARAKAATTNIENSVAVTGKSQAKTAALRPAVRVKPLTSRGSVTTPMS